MSTLLYLAGIAFMALPGETLGARPGQHSLRAFAVVANQCAFAPTRLEVNLGDRVRITLMAVDGPHSFVIDEYRIARRATPDRGVTFEFLADKAGTFEFVSNLASDAACADMRGELIVHRPRDGS